MEQQNTLTLQPSLAEVCDQFKHWRQTRKSRREPIPRQLWQAAAQLAGRYSINDISKALRLNYTDLKNHVHGRCCKETAKTASSAAFIELGCRPSLFESECIVEMEDRAGSKMRMCFKGQTNFDLLELGKAFWSKGK